MGGNSAFPVEPLASQARPRFLHRLRPGLTTLPCDFTADLSRIPSHLGGLLS